MRKLLATILSVTLLISAVIVPGMTVSAAVDVTTIDVWDGTTADTYAGGDGSEGNPYQISNAEQLIKMTKEGNGKYYILTNDIYINNVYDAQGEFNADWASSATNTWTTSMVEWNGNLNGNGNIIYGLYNVGGADPAGLIGAVSPNNSEVKNVISNLGVRYSKFSTTNQAAAFVAVLEHDYDGVSFYNCFADETVSLTSNGQYAATFAAFVYKHNDENTGAYLENCYSLAEVASTRQSAKLAATSSNGNLTFKNCYANGSILPTAGKNYYAPYAENSYINCYGTVAAADNAKGTWNVLTNAQMIGSAAATNMTAFDFENTWMTVEGKTPILRVFESKLNIPQAPVEDENGVWTGVVASAFLDDGAGTEADPIILNNAGELALAIQSGGKGKFFKLTKNIFLNNVKNSDGSFNADWASAENLNSWDFNTEFEGTIDGDGYIIYGLYANSTNNLGLAAKASRYTTNFKNLGIRYASLTGTGDSTGTGAFVGTVDVYKGNSTITNCFVDETVVINGYYAAGFVGYMKRNEDGAFVSINNCYSLADVTGSKNYSAFVCSYNGRWQIFNSYTIGQVGNTGGNDAYVSKLFPAYTNCYGTNSPSSKDTNNGNNWIAFSEAHMTGSAATSNMDLDFENTWAAVKDSTPILRVFADNLGIDINLYTITFNNDDGSEISSNKYFAGEEIVVPEAPTKDADETYTYEFAGWDKEVEATVTGNAVYTATYNEIYIDYTVIFKNEDGSLISENTYHYGDTVVLPTETPTKNSDSTYDYTFAGWDKEVTTVTGNIVYVAVFTTSQHQHSYDNDCDTTCNTCSDVRVISHKFDNNADTTCDICGETAYPGGNTLVKEDGVWYHIVNREKVTDTTLVQYSGTWYYVEKGVVNFSATTLVKFNGKWWYVKAGKMSRDNTLVKFSGSWWHVNGGNTTTSTTLVNYSGSWYYVKDGKMNTSNTLVKYNGVWYHVNGGKWVKDTTLVNYSGSWYYVKDGKMNTATTLVKYNGVWYYVSGGKVNFNYTGTVKFNGATYKVVKGKKV